MTPTRNISSFALPSLLMGLWCLCAQSNRGDVPASKAVHVTRLHRFEHSGVEAMLESEEKWHARTNDSDDLDSRKVALRSRSSRKHSVTHSVAQIEALQTHQQVELKARADEWEAELKREALLAKQEREEDALAVMKAGGDMMSALRDVRQRRGSRQPSKGGRAVTGLSDLQSQYVGPIGVGTTLSPPGCVANGQSGVSATAIEKVDDQHDETTLLQKHGVTCAVNEQEQIWVVFDTGSTNIWIASDLCKKGACVMEGRHRYNHTASATYSTPEDNIQLTVQFGTGKLVGPHGVDDFHIGPFTVRKQTFAMIQEQEGEVFSDVPFEGILGLAFPQMAAKGAHPFFDTIIDQKALEKNKFAFYFSPDNPSANAIFWGGVDPAFHEGKIDHFPVVDPYYWSLKLHSFRIGDEELLGDGTWQSGGSSDGGMAEGMAAVTNAAFANTLIQMSETSVSFAGKQSAREPEAGPRAIVDTGTTYFTAETKLFNQIMDRLSSRECKGMEETHPTITFRLGGIQGPVEYELTPEQYMTHSAGSSFCDPAFMKIDIPQQHGPAMILGETFLRHYIAVFDRGDGQDANARVGIAKSVHGEETNKRLKVLTGTQPAFGNPRERRT